MGKASGPPFERRRVKVKGAAVLSEMKETIVLAAGNPAGVAAVEVAADGAEPVFMG